MQNPQKHRPTRHHSTEDGGLYILSDQATHPAHRIARVLFYTTGELILIDENRQGALVKSFTFVVHRHLVVDLDVDFLGIWEHTTEDRHACSIL